MLPIEKLDPNFLAAEVQREGIVWYNARRAPFSLHGEEKAESGEKFCRVPRALAAELDVENPGNIQLNEHTSGIRVRFATSSPYIAVHATIPGIGLMSHMPLTGSAGFDVYADGVFAGTVRPDYTKQDRVDGIVFFDDARERQIQINLPLYNPVHSLFVGLDEKATLTAPVSYRHTVPMLFYGSSITQGGCASRPGNFYQAHLSRWLDSDYRSLGFSGHAKAEPAMAAYVAEQKMSVLVMDYDHNAPSPEYLEKTHERFFLTVREKQPTLPVVFVTKPDMITPRPSSVENLRVRKAIVKKTYENAKARGDKNVYFVDGESFFPDSLRDSCTVDGCHPTDLGFFFMAAGLEGVLRSILGEEGALHALGAPTLPPPALGDGQ